MTKIFKGIIVRDLTLYCRRQGEWMIPILFFVMIVSVFPMALDFSPAMIVKCAPAIIWVACVLALLFSLDNVFRLEYQFGSLEQFILSPYPLLLRVLGKAMAHWLAIGLPLLLLAPLMGITLSMPMDSIKILFFTLLFGIPLLSLLGLIGAALTIGLHRGGILLSIVVLPLMIPVMLLGTRCVSRASEALPFATELLLLAALFLTALVLAPLAIAAALRVSIE